METWRAVEAPRSMPWSSGPVPPPSCRTDHAQLGSSRPAHSQSDSSQNVSGTCGVRTRHPCGAPGGGAVPLVGILVPPRSSRGTAAARTDPGLRAFGLADASALTPPARAATRRILSPDATEQRADLQRPSRSHVCPQCFLGLLHSKLGEVRLEICEDLSQDGNHTLQFGNGVGFGWPKLGHECLATGCCAHGDLREGRVCWHEHSTAPPGDTELRTLKTCLTAKLW